MKFLMNDDEWLMRQIELEGDDDCVLGGNLVRLGDEDSDFSDVIQQLSLKKHDDEHPVAAQMNDDEWLMRQIELIGDDEYVFGGNLVRFGEDDPDYRGVVRQMSLEKEPGHVPPIAVPSVTAPQSEAVAK